MGDFDHSRQVLEEGQRLFFEQGSPWGAAFALSKLGLVMEGKKAFQQAMDFQREALDIFRSYGDRVGEAYCLSRMSVDAFALGDHDDSVSLATQDYEIFLETGHRWGIQVSRCRLAFALLASGGMSRLGSNCCKRCRLCWITTWSQSAFTR